MNKRFSLIVCLLLLLGVASASAAYTAPQAGKVYRIHNGKSEIKHFLIKTFSHMRQAKWNLFLNV